MIDDTSHEVQEVQSEITRIFNDYYAKLDEISSEAARRHVQIMGEFSDESIEGRLNRLVEIIIEKEENVPSATEETSNVYQEFETKLQEAKSMMDACETELRSKYGDLDSIIAYAQQQIESNGLTRRDCVSPN